MDASKLIPSGMPLVRANTSAASAPIVATAYPGSPGVPALFTRAAFPDLLTLGDAARLAAHQSALAQGARLRADEANARPG